MKQNWWWRYIFISLQRPDRVGLQNERHADGQDGARLPAGHRPLQPRSLELPLVWLPRDLLLGWSFIGTDFLLISSFWSADAKGLSNPSEVEGLREKVYASLESYTKQKYPDQPGRWVTRPINTKYHWSATVCVCVLSVWISFGKFPSVTITE